MKIDVLLLIILGITLSSCASFNEKYSCSGLWNINNQKYSFCYEKDTSDGIRKGFVKTGTQDWLIKPKYVELFVFNKKYIYTKKSGDKTFEVYNSLDDSFKDTSILEIWRPFDRVNYENNWSSLYFAKTKNNDIIPINQKTGEFSHPPIKNLDDPILNGKDSRDSIDPIIASPFRTGFLVRHKDGDRKYYQRYTSEGQPLTSEKIPADEVVVKMYVETLDRNRTYIVPFRVVDEKRNLIWPIFFNDGGELIALKDNKNVVGAIGSSIEWWKFRHLREPNQFANPSYLRIPIFSSLNILYKVDGKEFVVMNENILEAKNDITKVIANGLSSSEKYTDYKNVKGKDTNETSWIIERDYATYKNNKGEYVYSRYPDKPPVGSYAVTFKTQEEILNAIDYRTNNIKDVIKENENEFYTKELAKTRKERAIREAQKQTAWAQEERIRQEEAQERADRDAIDNARENERNAGWNRLGNQIQKAGAEAKAKANCVRKRTQTKKDYLAKKQGWYDTGGCE